MSIVSKVTPKNELLWQDRDVRFDVALLELKFRSGERIIEYFSKVEDTKGNAGEEGRLTITNLRLIWQSKVNTKINLSIGFGMCFEYYKQNNSQKISRKTRRLIYNDKSQRNSL